MTKSNCEDCVHAERTEGRRMCGTAGGLYIQNGPGITCRAGTIEKIDIRGDGFYCSSYEPKRGIDDLHM